MSKGFKEDLTGQRFGRWTVLEFVPNENTTYTLWRCRCDCGNIGIVQGRDLKSGRSKSCRCYQREVVTKHGLYDNPLHSVWASMKFRCLNCNDRNYKNYGGRGIIVCNEWLNDFKAFYDWAMTNGYKEGLSIDRIDVNGNYEPNNCRWVNSKVQNRNKRNNVIVEYQGEKITLQEASEILNMPYNTLSWRYRAGDRGDRLFRPTENKQLKL